MANQTKPAFPLVFSAVMHLTGLAMFLLSPAPRAVFQGFFWQFHLLWGLSFLCSLLINLFNRGRSFLIPFRLLLILLLAYPTAHYIWIGALLMMTLTMEAALYTPLPWGRVGVVFCIVPLYLFQKDRSAFNTQLMGADLPDLILLGLLPLLTGLGTCMYRRNLIRTEELIRQSKRLDLAASRLIEANLGYQNYAKQLEARTLNEERRRISREIHDSVGYSLTNVRVMLEAGMLQMEGKPREARELISRAMEESRRCLEETRAAMRELRDRESPEYRGLAAVNRLARAFETSTGIEVNLEFGEAPSLFEPHIDKIVYRLIQEAMTNAFRHGMASRVDIMFWSNKRILQILVRDNGKGAPTLKEGLGLTGMRERVRQIGGTVVYGNSPGGFQVRAEIPLTSLKKGEENG